MSEQASEVANPFDTFVEPDFEKLLCGIERKLAISFFNYFSRFEHALKMRDFKIVNKKGYLTGVNWEGFHPNIPYPSNFEQLDNAVDYLCKTPVKRQKHDLSWEVVEPIEPVKFESALSQVPHIRNNLFHGGKYLKPDPKRDNELLNAAIIVLKACLINDEYLKREFDNTGV